MCNLRTFSGRINLGTISSKHSFRRGHFFEFSPAVFPSSSNSGANLGFPHFSKKFNFDSESAVNSSISSRNGIFYCSPTLRFAGGVTAKNGVGMRVGLHTTRLRTRSTGYNPVTGTSVSNTIRETLRRMEKEMTAGYDPVTGMPDINEIPKKKGKSFNWELNDNIRSLHQQPMSGRGQVLPLGADGRAIGRPPKEDVIMGSEPSESISDGFNIQGLGGGSGAKNQPSENRYGRSPSVTEYFQQYGKQDSNSETDASSTNSRPKQSYFQTYGGNVNRAMMNSDSAAMIFGTTQGDRGSLPSKLPGLPNFPSFKKKICHEGQDYPLGRPVPRGNDVPCFLNLLSIWL